jgi:hypothetical protein
MKQRRKSKQAQIELFCDVASSGNPTPLEVPPDRLNELKQVVSELLLTLVLENAEVREGVEHDA